MLEDAIYRLLGRGPAPVPVRATIGELLAGAQGVDLVADRQRSARLAPP